MTRDARLRELAGGVLVVGLRGPVLEPAERETLAGVAPAGVILFARNLQSPEQALALVGSVRDVLDDPLVLVDQEGGRVDRLRPWRGRSPSARELAAAGVHAVREEAERTARDVRAIGVNFNCAPVVDLDEGHDANGVGDRTYGTDPQVVAACAREVLEAHARAGVLTSLKHFPGLGRTREDSHLSRPHVDATLEDLCARELVPFRELLPQAPSVMVSHAAFPALTGHAEPASLSTRVVDGLLRGEMGYDGLVVTDDLDMGAVTDVAPERRAAVALAAGCDLALLCQDFAVPVPARDAIVAAVLSGALPASRLEAAHARVARARRTAARGLLA